MTQQEITEHARKLVAIPSTADNKPALHQAVEYIATILAAHKKITVERFESNGTPSLLAYYGNTRPRRFDTILNAHVDVVAGSDAQFNPVVKGEQLIGRGAYDMKVAAIAMTDAFIQAGDNPVRPIGLQVVADEEIGGKDGVLYHLQQGIEANFVILGEMTNLGICNESRGICWAEIAFTGATAHGGYAWKGINAVTKASDFANSLLQRFPVPKEQQWCTTANIAAITTGNETFNIVPGDATLKVDFRFTPEDPHFQTHETVTQLIASIDPTAKIIDMPVFEPAVNVSPEDPYLRHFIRTYETATKNEAMLIRRYASSDGRLFAVKGIPVIEFGISGADHHADNEYADLTTIEPFKNTLVAFLRGAVPLNTAALSAKNVLATA